MSSADDLLPGLLADVPVRQLQRVRDQAQATAMTLLASGTADDVAWSRVYQAIAAQAEVALLRKRTGVPV